MNRTVIEAKGSPASIEGELEHFFDFELHDPSRESYVSAENRDGPFIASATGTITGKEIHGKIKMSFYAADCAYLLVQAGVDPGPGQHLCKENDGGIIETEDGAKITFNTRGYGLRGADPLHPKKWRLSMAVQFSTKDKRYRWLNTAFGLWEGQFDEEQGRATYKTYIFRYP